MTCGAETVNTNGYPEVKTFLNSLSLQKYEDRFIDNGIEDEETILELGDDHLDQMCVPLGHKLKILKRIKIIRQEKGMRVPESRQGSRPSTAQSMVSLPPQGTPQKSSLKKKAEPIAT